MNQYQGSVYIIKKDVFDYELTGEEQILTHAIKYAVAVDDIATGFNGVIGPLLIYANFIERLLTSNGRPIFRGFWS